MRLSPSPKHRAWLRQATRTLAAVFLSDLVARFCGLGEAGWALITASIVTSTSVASTWTAGRDQIVGTLIGALAGIVAIELSLLGLPRMAAFAAMLVPLALLAAARPTLRLTCVTLVVVLLFPSASNNPFERPFDRVAAILIGAVMSLAVSFLVFRSRARASAFQAAAAMLATLAELLAEVLSATGSAPARDALADRTIASVRSLSDAVNEARREHVSALERADPLLVRLLPMLRRLQSDVLFVTRALDELGDATAIAAKLQPARQALCLVFDGLRRRCEAIARDERHAEPATEAAAEIATLDATLDSLGDTAGVPLRFTLQMLRRDLDDMEAAIELDGRNA